MGSFIFLTIFTLRRGGTKQIKHKIDEQKMTLHVDAPFYKLYCILSARKVQDEVQQSIPIMLKTIYYMHE